MRNSMLLCRAGGATWAIPLSDLAETTRLLPINRIDGMPDFIDGVATIRGAAVPVVRLAELLGESGGAARRLVVTKVGSRRVALAVDTIVGIRDIGPDMLTALPPLLHNADTEAVERLGSLDGEFLMVLQAAHVIADDVLDAIDQAASA